MKKLLVLTMALMVALTCACKTTEEITINPYQELYSGLPALQAPIEAEPYALPTFPPSAAPIEVREPVMLEVVDDYNLVMKNDFITNISNILTDPKVSYTYTIEELESSLVVFDGISAGEEVKGTFEISNNALNLRSSRDEVGFYNIRMTPSEVIEDAQYGLLIKFKSNTNRTLRFRLESSEVDVGYLTSMEICFESDSDIVYSNWKGQEEGHRYGTLSISSIYPNDFRFIAGECYYAFFYLDADSNLVFLTWQENKPGNYAFYYDHLSETYGEGELYKGLSWQLGFNANFGEEEVDFYLYESYIIACGMLTGGF